MMDINTTPLIDVMLVLLVMLIITIPIQLHSVNLNMPIGNPPPPLVKPEVVKIDIDFDGTVYWNGEVVPDRAALETRLRDAAAAGRSSPRCTCGPNKLAEYKIVADGAWPRRSGSASPRSASSAASSSSGNWPRWGRPRAVGVASRSGRINCAAVSPDRTFAAFIA